MGFKEQIDKIADNYQTRRKRLYTEGLFAYLFGNRGYIMVLVMIMLTLLISVSTDFLINAQININYMKKFRDESRAETIALTGITIAEKILMADKNGISVPFFASANTNKSIDTYEDLWAQDIPEISLGSGSVKVIISDEQSKINISALANKFVDKSPFFGILNRFFQNMGFPEDFAEAVLDWVDKDSQKTGYGAETYDYYSTLPQPYETQNGPFDSINQLLLVHYFTPRIYYGLGGGNMEEEAEEATLVETNSGVLPFDPTSYIEQIQSGQMAADDDDADEEDEDEEEIIVGPEISRALEDYLRVNGNNSVFNANINKININTAPYRVIMALDDDMNEQKVEALIKRRLKTPFTSANATKAYITDELIRKNCITTKSDLFRITAIGYVGRNYKKITAIYDRASKKYLYFAIQ